MPIPPEFNGDLYLWINQVLTDLNESNTRLSNLRSAFTGIPRDILPQLKDFTIRETQRNIDDAIIELSLIRDEIGRIPDEIVAEIKLGK